MSDEQLPGPQIVIRKNGPYRVSGGLPLSEQWIATNSQGESLDYREGEIYSTPPEYELCRCGQSSKQPFCNDNHKKIGFDGTETASRQPYSDQAEIFEGPTMLLADATSLCAFARFCDPKGRIWNLIYQTGDLEARRLVEYESGHCPGGRLVAWDRETGKSVEPTYEPSLGLIEDAVKRVSGPIWVRGGIPVVSADGYTYEVRNQVALCRCGRSDNMPFCNGSHAA
jgi:CDGSH-type Zn-finger protein